MRNDGVLTLFPGRSPRDGYLDWNSMFNSMGFAEAVRNRFFDSEPRRKRALRKKKLANTGQARAAIDIGSYISHELIIPEMGRCTREEAVKRLVDLVFATKSRELLPGLTAEDVFNEVMAHENTQTTGIGNGLAFPHARISNCKNVIVAVGICTIGVDFNSTDGQPARIICLTIAPAEQYYIIQQMTAAFFRFFANSNNVTKLTEETDKRRIAAALEDPALVCDRELLAQDLMRQVRHKLHLDTSIEEATKVMQHSRIDILPVVDDENTLCGEISCLKIFTYGVPDFFNQLQTVSFVRNLDPFEKYFKLRRDLTVKDIYTPRTVALPMDATLLEVTFQMTAKRRFKIYIVNGRRLMGEIDHFSIIDRILFL